MNWFNSYMGREIIFDYIDPPVNRPPRTLGQTITDLCILNAVSNNTDDCDEEYYEEEYEEEPKGLLESFIEGFKEGLDEFNNNKK